MWSALNSTDSLLVTYLVGLVGIGLAVGITGFAIGVLARPAVTDPERGLDVHHISWLEDF
jgi:hypothetical protein